MLSLFSAFIRCVACNGKMDPTRDFTSFPLCSFCDQSLLPCPQLCEKCGGPACLMPDGLSIKIPCKRPWIEHPTIDSFSALYLLLNTGFPVLRAWKKSRGSLFDRKVLKSNPTLLNSWEEFQPQGIVPIPQLFSRAWKMRGSPAERIAHWISSAIAIPCVLALQPPHRDKTKRQAELTLRDRLQKPLRFTINPDEDLSRIQRVILVDDFVTSGRTLDQASKILKGAGIEKIHAFSLGMRASRNSAKS